MPTPLSGPGVGLPLPQNLYPSELGGMPYDISTNQVGLSPGDTFAIPAGTFYVNLGQYCILQFLDPITGTWQIACTAGWSGGPVYVKSDGFNYRVANMLACPVGAVVTSAGASYVQASTTVSVTGGGGSTWLPIVGGALAVVGGTLTSNGAGYGIAPIVLIPAPPPAASNPNGVGGIPASAYATIASGTVSGISFTNQGAGYPTAPTAVIVPSPFDPNLATGITAATVAFSLTASGSITGVLCTNSGAALATPANITLTVGGVGVTATISAVVLRTTTLVSVTGAGAGYTGPFAYATVGGAWPTQVFAGCPETLGIKFRPRPAQIVANSVTANFLPTIIDGGLFASVPTAVFGGAATGGVLSSVTLATLALTMGSVPDIVTLNPAP